MMKNYTIVFYKNGAEVALLEAHTDSRIKATHMAMVEYFNRHPTVSHFEVVLHGHVVFAGGEN